jgi:hypothetical protein
VEPCGVSDTRLLAGLALFASGRPAASCRRTADFAGALPPARGRASRAGGARRVRGRGVLAFAEPGHSKAVPLRFQAEPTTGATDRPRRELPRRGDARAPWPFRGKRATCTVITSTRSSSNPGK